MRDTLHYNHILLETSFGPKCGPLADHYTTTHKKILKLCVPQYNKCPNFTLKFLYKYM